MIKLPNISESGGSRRLRSIRRRRIIGVFALFLISSSIWITHFSYIYGSKRGNIAFSNNKVPTTSSLGLNGAPRAGLTRPRPAPVPDTARNRPSPDKPAGPKHAAVLIENRPLSKLIPLILHFNSILGPGWPIKIITTPSSSTEFLRSSAIRSLIKQEQLTINFLPPSIDFTHHSSVSAFFTSPWLWKTLAPAEKVLFFQADSMICSRAKVSIDDFLDYDFIGAPLDPNPERGLGKGYNGGLSLRNRAMCEDIVKRFSWADERDERTRARLTKELEEKEKKETASEQPASSPIHLSSLQSSKDHETETETEVEEKKEGQEKEEKEEDGEMHPNTDYEDQWFYYKMQEFMPEAKLPGIQEASRFAVETLWAEEPWGYHQAHVWQRDKMRQVMEWCPEYGLIETQTFEEHS
ncbi:hypothetical protein BP5796_10565 [Coleophoma crateriformis]|uniref:DUF5672 domain-containing protein n=1 Tax=Coleophoma crateriformis TaxID=565419 RepID=A0A3D8QQG6_9HELO|nr:hypothetical protein BP5796_10565 [Coleophoma crateriformis]